MSRNLSEGNPSKDAAATEFGVRQLFRRPAPTPLNADMVIAYAYLATINDQTDPFPTDVDDNPGNYADWTEAFTSDESILYPDFSNGSIYLGAEGGYPGDSNHSSPGYYIASCSVAGWDNWTGAGTQVLDSIRGCGVVWSGRLDNREVTMILQPPTGLAGVPDSQSVCTDSGIIQRGASNRVRPWVAQYSGIDAGWTQVSLSVALISPYLWKTGAVGGTAVGKTSPDFGKWYP